MSWHDKRRAFTAYAVDGGALWWRRDYFEPLEDPTPWHLFQSRENGAQRFTNVWYAECGQGYEFDEQLLEIRPKLRRTEPKRKTMCPECRDIYETEYE